MFRKEKKVTVKPYNQVVAAALSAKKVNLDDKH